MGNTPTTDSDTPVFSELLDRMRNGKALNYGPAEISLTLSLRSAAGTVPGRFRVFCENGRELIEDITKANVAEFLKLWLKNNSNEKGSTA